MALTKVIGAGVGNLTTDLGVGSTNTPTSSSGGNLIAIETTADEHTNLVFNTANTAKNGIIEGRRTGRGSYERFAQINLQNDSDNGEIRFYTAASGSDVSEKMRIDSTGAVTKPLQPAFSAKKNGTDQLNIAINTSVTITFGYERFDLNSDYNTSNSTFTAPVTGKYFFSTSVYFNQVDSGADYMTFGIETSNQSYRVIFDTNEFSSDLDYYSFTATVLADMDASDTAYVHFLQSGGTAQADANGSNNYTYFTGYLVC